MKTVPGMMSRRALVVSVLLVPALIMTGCGVSPADPTQGVGSGTQGVDSGTHGSSGAHDPYSTEQPSGTHNPSNSAGENGSPTAKPAPPNNDPVDGSDPTSGGAPSWTDSGTGTNSKGSEEFPAKDGGIDWSIWPQNVTLSSRLVDVIVPSALSALYPSHVMSQLVPQAATVVAMSQGGLPGLYKRRSGNEHDFYQPIRPFVTAQLWSQLEIYIAKGLTGESHQIGSFAPQTTRDGVWTHIGGIAYTTTGSDSVHMYGTPRVQVESENVLVSFDIEVVGRARPSDVRYEATYTAVMQYEDGAWRMNGWQNLLTSSIEVVSGENVNQ